MNKKVYISSLLLGCALAISSCPLSAMKARLAKIFKKEVRSIVPAQKQSDIQKICTEFQGKDVKDQQADFDNFVSEIKDKLNAITNDKDKKSEAKISVNVIEQYFTDISKDTEKDRDKYQAFCDHLMMVSDAFASVGFDDLIGEALDVHLKMLEAVFVIHEEFKEAEENIAANKDLEKELAVKNKELEAVQIETELALEAAAEVCSSAATVNQQTQLAIKAAEAKTQALRQITDACAEKTKVIKGSLLDQESLI